MFVRGVAILKKIYLFVVVVVVVVDDDVDVDVLWGACCGGGFLFLQETEKLRTRTRKNVFWKDCSLG